MLHVANNPCESCPYRKDVPAGIWHPEEYAKLALYDEQPGGIPELAVFLCHHTPDMPGETVCRGWLSVHADSVAVRLAISRDRLTGEQVDAPVTVPLFRTGAAAAKAGLKGCKRPSAAAVRLMRRLEANRLRRITRLDTEA